VTTLSRSKEKLGDAPILSARAGSERAGSARASPRLSARGSVNESKFRPLATYKSLYTEKNKVTKVSKVINIVSRDKGTVGQEFACRRVPLTSVPQSNLTKLGKHCQALQSLEHPHICKFVECFQDTRELLLVYEKAETTTLFEHVRSRGCLTEEDAANYLRQAVMAFSVAHESKLYHGRLSPSKILLAFKDANLDEEDAIAQLKICDWGQTFILSADPVQAPPSKGVESMRYCVSPELADK